jgi:predicted ribosome quality control (RQC) complex YloA/Tae2 family protein
VRAAADDRVIRILGSRGPEGARTEKELILELLGRDSNILLVDSSTNLIMDCLHRIPQKETGTRVVMPGAAYEPPPPRGNAGVMQPAAAESRELHPAITTGPWSKKRLTLVPEYAGSDVFPSMNAAADAFFQPQLQSAMLDALKRELAAPLKARVKSLERRMLKIQADADRLKRLADRQYEGELLKSNLGRIKKGMDAIEVRDWATGNPRVVRLDPALAPVANMERIFRKAAKGKRGEKKVLERQLVTLEEKRAVQDMLYYVESAADVAHLDQVAFDYTTGSAEPKKGTSAKPRKDALRESTLYHRFPIHGDRAILVGKSAAGNDVLMRRKARPGDWWFHVKDYPGAHVLLPAGTMCERSREETACAAACAVHFSKARDRGKVDVIVAQCSDVETVRGGFKGQVRIKKHSTVLSDGLLDAPPWAEIQ